MFKNSLRLYFYNMNLGPRHFFKGVGYWRMKEYPWVISRLEMILQHFGGDKNIELLDIGSGDSPLAPFLAERYNINVHSIDVEKKGFHHTLEHARIIKNRGNSKLVARLVDARKLPFPDSSFNFITSISVFEHIPDRGDTEAFLEVLRVLKPNGSFFLTVPYSLQYREYSKRSRFYDINALNERFLEYLKEQNCELIENKCIKQRYFSFYPYCFRIPLVLRAFLSPLFPIWARVFLEESRCDHKDVILHFLWIKKIPQ